MNSTAVASHDAAAQRETNASTLELPTGVEALERIKDALRMFAREADPVVLNRQPAGLGQRLILLTKALSRSFARTSG